MCYISQFYRKVYIDGQQVLSAEILEGSPAGAVWISGFHFARNTAKLAQHKIGAILSAVDLHIDYSELNPERLILNVEDQITQIVICHFDSVYDFIERNRSRTNVLVHCAGGISRSSTLLISYIMRKYKKTYDEAYNIVKSKRRIIQPNTGFETQLRQYEQQLLHPEKLLKENSLYTEPSPSPITFDL